MSTLADYPATANPLPVAWDGAQIVWSQWRAGNVFICARGPSKSEGTCTECGSRSPRMLSIRGHVYQPQYYLSLMRCPNCGADSVVDWEGNAWELNESDYGPDGSWEDCEETLFDHITPLRCGLCGRRGEAGFITGSDGSARCVDDELCYRRARKGGLR